MTEELIDELIAFFPLDSVDWGAGTYDQYLYDLRKTVLDNYGNGNYQVSYFFAHLIFMSYVYYSVEKAYRFRPERMKDIFYPINAYNGRQDKPDLENYKSVYEFSKIPEKEIFKLFYIMGMEKTHIKDMSSYISRRDNYAHATGAGNISEDMLNQNIETIKGSMELLHNLFKNDLKALYIKFLLDNFDKNKSELEDNIYNFIYDNALSLCDLSYLVGIGISDSRNSNEKLRENYRFVSKVRRSFVEYCNENYSIN